MRRFSILGLFLFSALGACERDGASKPDSTAPAFVDDLNANAISDSTVLLTWTAPGDDGSEGRASEYDVRISSEAFSEDDWEQASRILTTSPKPAGNAESLRVAGLVPGSAYLFAVRTADEVPNWSGISNYASPLTFEEAPPVLELVWGTHGTGDGEFDDPGDISVFQGTVYVADWNNHRIQVFGEDGQFLTKWGHESDPRPPQFGTPNDIAVDADGNVYICSSEVTKCDADGSFISRWEYGGESIAVDDSGNIFTTGGSWDARRIVVFDQSGNLLRSWGTTGSGDGQFTGPQSLALDNKGHLYVADSYNYRVQKFTVEGEFLIKWGTQGSQPGQFNLPSAIAWGSNGIVYVGEAFNRRIQMFNEDGIHLGGWGFSSSVSGLDVNGSNEVFASDWSGAIQVFTADGQFIRSFGRSARCEANLSHPRGLAIGRQGRAYVADPANSSRVAIFDAQGEFMYAVPQKYVTAGSLSQSFYLDHDEQGLVYVADNEYQRIQVYDGLGMLRDGWSVFNPPASIIAGLERISVSMNNDLARYSSGAGCLPGMNLRWYTLPPVTGLAEGENRSWLALFMEGEVRAYRDDQLIATWGSGGAGRGLLKTPEDLTVDNDGNVYIADTGNDRIQKFSADGRLLSAWGQHGMNPGQFVRPSAIALQGDGAIFVVDSGNDRIQKFRREN